MAKGGIPISGYNIKVEKKHKPATLDTALECIAAARKILAFYDLSGVDDVDGYLNRARVSIELIKDPQYLEKKLKEVEDD